jgi:hypothetical protein
MCLYHDRIVCNLLKDVIMTSGAFKIFFNIALGAVVVIVPMLETDYCLQTAVCSAFKNKNV